MLTYLSSEDVSGQYSQHEVLFPAGVVASDGNRCRLDILQFECHVRVKLVCNDTHRNIAARKAQTPLLRLVAYLLYK